MISWLLGVVFCLVVVVGCGGGKQGNLVKMEPPPPEATANVAETTEANVADNETDAALTEQLSSKRLEELYAKSGIPGWDPSLEEELKNWEHQVKFDVPIHMNKQVRAYLVYFSTERKEIIRRYLSRSTRYLPMIKDVFQEYGLPEDLAYLAMIESGFSAKAYSSANASGMWQFIKGTGLRYGLAIDSYVDERRDPEKSTRAAAKYLLDLYKQFGSWYLAAASYNCGEGRVQRELDGSKHKNFWELSANMCLPTETKNYVPQMIAATIIAKNPEKFGFKNVPYLPPLKYDRVQVNESTSLQAAAVAVNVPVEEIQALNPELSRGVTPPEGSYSLNLPANSKEAFNKNITIARIEHPAIATRPVRVARSSGRSYTSGRSYAPRQAAVARKSTKRANSQSPYPVVAKPEKKSAAAAPAMLANKAKPASAGPTPVEATPYTASIFGKPGAGATKSAAAGKGKADVQVASSSKGKAKMVTAPKAVGKKSGEAAAAKKSDGAGSANKAKTPKKNTSSTNRSKDKYSKAKPSSLLVSEAR